MEYNLAQRELAIKLVYYGPPMGGKTTNLHAIHERLEPDRRGRLTVLDSADERTVFFDLLPLSARTEAGYAVSLRLYSVPGQVMHATTRKVVLSGADGIVFVADSQRSMARTNSEFWYGMRHNLLDSQIDPDRIPTVIQFNKRDLPDVRSDSELAEVRRGVYPVFTAVAIRGEGVMETLTGILRLVLRDLNGPEQVGARFSLSADSVIESLLGEGPSSGAMVNKQPGGSP